MGFLSGEPIPAPYSYYSQTAHTLYRFPIKNQLPTFYILTKKKTFRQYKTYEISNVVILLSVMRLL